MGKSTPLEEKSRDVRADDGDANSLAKAPSWVARRCVVLVFERVEEKAEQREWYTRDYALCIVDPETGGAASVYDSETWADASRAENYACLANIESSDELRRCWAFVDGGGRMRWPDGTAAKRRP